MNIFMRVAINSLKSAKSRTVVTIVGVALSACLFTIVTTLIFSGYDIVIDAMLSKSTDFQMRIYDKNDEYYSQMSKDKNIEIVSKLNEVGYGSINIDYTAYGVAPEEVDSIKPKMYVYGGVDEKEDYKGIRIRDGEKPTKSDEIIISEKMAADLGESGQIGDYINVSLVNITKDVEKIEDFVTNATQVNYKIVGIYTKELFSYIDDEHEYAFTVSDKNLSVLGSQLFIKYDSKKYDKESFFDEYKLTKKEAKINRVWYETNGISRYRNLAIVIVVLNSVYWVIFIATCIMISSTFSISYNERIKQFGLIKSLGATKTQLRKIINYEANYVAAIGVPIGMLIGIIIVNIIFLLSNKNLKADDFLAMSNMYDVELEYKVSIESILVSLIFIVLTIKVASLRTLNRATKMKSIEAIRENNLIRLRANKLKVGKWFSKFASVERFMSKKYYKASKKSYRMTVISLAMSIVIIVSIYSSYDFLMRVCANAFNTIDYDMRVNMIENPSTTYAMSLYNYQKAKSSIKSIKGAENTFIYAYDDVGLPYCMVNKNDLTEKAIKDLDISEELENNNGKEQYQLMLSNLYVDDETYMNIISEAGLDYIKYTSTEQPPAILYNVVSGSGFSIFSNKYSYYNIFNNPVNEMQLVYETDQENKEQLPKTLVVGDMINKKLKGLDTFSANSLYVIYPDRMAPNVQYYSVVFDVDNYDIMIKQVNNWKKASNLGNTAIENNLYYKNLMKSSKGVSDFGAIGFLVLIIMIAMANVFNTITANILSRKRDFAVLKSTGMSNKAINKMLVYECISYGTKSVIVGVILSGLAVSSLAQLIYTEKKEMMTNSFIVNAWECFNEAIPWKVMIGSIILVYIVVFISAFYALSRVKKNNIIETLKNDLV